MSDCFGDGVPDVPDGDSEVGVNSGSDFLDESVGTFLVLGLLHGSGSLSVGILTLVGCWWRFRHGFFLSHNLCSVLQVVDVVSEQIVLLRVDDRFHNFSGLVPLRLKYSSDNFHNIRNDSGETHEDLFNDSSGEILEEVVDFVQAVEGGVS